jgi:RHS repeat-associated protein
MRLTRHTAPEIAARLSHSERRIQVMTLTDQQAAPSKACVASKVVSWPAETGPRNPQASYYRARYYDPSTARFQTEDPIGFRGGADFYAYVHNDATVFIDPMGLLQVCCRRANVSIATGWAWLTSQGNGCHCFVRLSNGDTLGGYFSYRHFGELVKGMNDNSDHNKYAREANCSDAPGSPCENDARARKAFDALPNDIGIYGFGMGMAGTSNAVAVTILKNAGFDWTPPTCAWGAFAKPLPPPDRRPFPGLSPL